MGTFAVWHPDVEAFIDAKRTNGAYRQFNLSLLIDDDFMDAVISDKDWHLVFPIKKRDEIFVIEGQFDVIAKERFWDKEYCKAEKYTITEDDKLICRIYKTVRARDLWDKMMKSTYDYSEPGFLLIDRINKYNNLYFVEIIRASNPCGRSN